MKPILSSLLSVAALSSVAAVQEFLSVPTYSEVNPGQSVTLVCEVANKGGECRWEKDGTPVGIFPDKYEWAGDLETGNCSLVILDASAEYDDGVWQCQVTASNFKLSDSLISDGAEVVVRAPPTSVTLVSKQGEVAAGESVVTMAGSRLDIKCVAEGGNPVPRLSFSLNGRPVTSETGRQTNTRLASGGWRSSLQLAHIPSKGEDGAELLCQAHHEALARPLEVRSSLNVQFAPTVTSVRANSTELNEGDSLSLHCQVESNPASSIAWKKLSAPGVIIGRGETLLLRDMELSMNGVYICEAENEVGIGEGRSEPVRTHHAPIMRQVGPSPSLMLLRGQTLRLSCLAEASPAPVYTWLQRTASGDLRLRSSEVSDTGDLVLEDVSYGDSGEFLCRASNTVAGQPREVLSEPVSVEVRGAPELREEDTRDILLTEGETLDLRVEFCSNPTPVISWRFGQLILDESNVETDAGNNCAVSDLKLDEITMEDAGEYFLRGENEHGHSEQRIILTVAKTIFTREIIIAMVAGSLLTIALVTLVTVSRCRANNNKEPEVRDVESCGTSTTSDNNKNEKIESDNESETIVFNESYERFESQDVMPDSLHKPAAYRPSYTDLCNFPRSANGGSMRVSNPATVDKMISMYNSNILEHINTMNFTQHNNQDNIYYWRQNFDNKIYS